MSNRRRIPFRSMHVFFLTLQWGVSVTLAVMAGATALYELSRYRTTTELMPWKHIGGCGASGSGGGSAGIRWVGEGVSGGRVKLEFLPKLNVSKDYFYLTVLPRFTGNLSWNTEAGVSVPLGYKRAAVSFLTNMEKRDERNGGVGDVSADITRSFGIENQYAVQIALTIPTGQFDVADKYQSLLPQSMQMGQGVYTATLGFSYTRDIRKGMLLFDAYLYYPFNLSFNGKNRYIDGEYRAYQTVARGSNRFYYWFKPYGENDRGGYFPPAINLDGIYAYRGVRKVVQSTQLFFSVPLGVRWIPYYDNTSHRYDPRPDPDHRAWDLTIAYGVEFSNDKMPLYLGVGLPIHDKTQDAPSKEAFNQKYYGVWNAPDWNAAGRELLFAAGVKVAMF